MAEPKGMIAGGLRWALYLAIATVACFVLFFAFFLGGSGFFGGLISGSHVHGHLTGPLRVTHG